MNLLPLRPRAVAAYVDRNLGERYNWRPSFVQTLAPLLLYSALLGLGSAVDLYFRDSGGGLYVALGAAGVGLGTVVVSFFLLITFVPGLYWLFFAMFGGSGSFLGTAVVVAGLGIRYFLPYALVYLLTLALDLAVQARIGSNVTLDLVIGGYGLTAVVLVVLSTVVGLCNYAAVVFGLAHLHGFTRPYLALAISVPVLFLSVVLAFIGLVLLIGGTGLLFGLVGNVF